MSEKPDKAQTRAQADASKEIKKRGKLAPALCTLFGTLLLLAVIALCLPLTAPRFMGYQVYDVVSGSMEPEIPVGSVVYVKPVNPTEIQEGEIIAFYGVSGANPLENAPLSEEEEQVAQEGADGSVIVHRVVTNRTSLGEFVTRGDANNVDDLNPIPYDNVIGRVESHYPFVGTFMAIYASTAGKVYLLLTAACGVMLNILAGRMRSVRAARERQLAEAAAEVGITTEEAKKLMSTKPGAKKPAGGGSGTTSSGASKKRKGGKLRVAIIAILAVVFLGSAGVVGYVNWQYAVSDSLYHEASDKFTSDDGEVAPIKVNFKELQAQNPDIVGWIYCEDTVIDYPVLQGRDNDQYLHTDYTGAYNIDGSIFVNATNRKDFIDSNTIIYGHHMNSGSMFASLVKWADQDFYEKHPVMWLLTPTQDYKIQLFAGHHLDGYSVAYDAIYQPGVALYALLGKALADTEFDANAAPDEQMVQATANALAAAANANANGGNAANAANAAGGANAATPEQTEAMEQLRKAADPNAAIQLGLQDHYVMLSTCAYLFDNDRYVLNGKLIPVDSAGGKKK